MAASEYMWEHWLERLYNLRRDRCQSHERPHKPALLLSVIDLLDRGRIKTNAVPFNEDLVSTFKSYFDVVRAENDQPTIENPFYRLSGDGVWQLFAAGARDPLYRGGEAGRGLSTGQLRSRKVVGRFDDDLWSLVKDPASRHQLREALIARYFPGKRPELDALVRRDRNPEDAASLKDEAPPGRDAAFRRTILEVYDYRCAACGIRVRLTDQLSLVQADHLIPFQRSRNDNPTNGVALCPNHHWAMDRFLIAPCPDPARHAGVWRVNDQQLDDRIEGQRELFALAGRPVIPPKQKKFYPAKECLSWREEHLFTPHS